MKVSMKYMILFFMGMGMAGAVSYGIYLLKIESTQRDDKISARLSAMESYMKNVSSMTDTAIKSQTKQMQNLDQKLSSLALSLKTGSTDSEQAQELLKLILSTYHDLDVMIQALIVEQILLGHNPTQWVIRLDRLSAQDKLNFQRMLDKRTNWQDVLDTIDEQLKKNQPIVLWGIADRLGIRVENGASPEDLVLEDLKQQVQQHNYHGACQRMLDLPAEDPVAQKLEDVCLADSFVAQYWKTLND